MKKSNHETPPFRDRKKDKNKYFTFFYRSRWVTTYSEDNPKKPTKYVVFMWSFALGFLLLGLLFISNSGSVGAGIFVLLLAALFLFVGIGFIREWKEYKQDNDSTPNRKK